MSAAPRASVVIPVKNAGGTIAGVLAAVFAQRYAPGFDVLVIDSGSRDGTLDLVAGYPATLLRIPPEEFSHGGTRNLGAARTTGEFVVYLTHDAQPVRADWLERLVAPFDLDASVAGCFGRHVPHPGCDPIDARNLERHFAALGDAVTITRIESEAAYLADRARYDFFSNNNSAVRRSVWERIPFPVVQMAEDQLWAQAMLRAGHAKAYVPDAPVFHSHSYPPAEWMRRWYDEFTSYRDLGSPVQMRRPAQALRYVASASRDDIAYLRGVHGPASAATLRHAARAVLNNAGRGAGALLGSNYPSLPEAVRRRLSMQGRMRRA